MESLYNKEKRLEIVLGKLTNLSRSSKSYVNSIDDLYVEKNQLQSEKNEIESKYSPDLAETSFSNSLSLLVAELKSPNFWGRPINIYHFLKANLKYAFQKM